MPIYKSTGHILEEYERVHMNLPYIEEHADTVELGENGFDYIMHIRKNPKRIYKVLGFNFESEATEYILSDKMGGTSWLSEELIHIPKINSFFELIKNMNIAEMTDIFQLWSVKKNMNTENAARAWLQRKPARVMDAYLHEPEAAPKPKGDIRTAYKIGDRVRMNIASMMDSDRDGIEFTADNTNYWRYMNEHPMEIYTVTDIDNSYDTPHYVLSGFMGSNDWYADELLYVKPARTLYEQIIQSTEEELAALIPVVVEQIKQANTTNQEKLIVMLNAAPIRL